MVIVMEGKANLIFDRNTEKINPWGSYKEVYASSFKKIYLLVNEKRKEAFLPAMDDNYLNDSFSDISNESRVRIKAKHLEFASSSQDQGLPKLDKEWLQDARLVRVDAIKVGTQRALIKQDNFVVPEKSSYVPAQENEFEKAIKRQESQQKALRGEGQ